METKKIKATLTQGKDMKLTLRIWVTEEDRRDVFCLETGKQPQSLFDVVVMEGGEE